MSHAELSLAALDLPGEPGSQGTMFTLAEGESDRQRAPSFDHHGRCNSVALS